MDVNWTNPRVVSLHERLAATIQREYEDSLTAEGRVADAQHLGARAASEILQAAADFVEDSDFDGVLFSRDPAPRRDAQIFCDRCDVGEGQLHEDFCSRTGVLRWPDRAAVL